MMRVRFSETIRLHGGRVQARVSTKLGVVHFGVKNDEHRVFCSDNRTIIAIVPFEGKKPSHEWLEEQGLKALENAPDNLIFSEVVQVQNEQVHAMISVESEVVHFAVRDEAYPPSNRTVIAIVPFEDGYPSNDWLEEQGLKALKTLKTN